MNANELQEEAARIAPLIDHTLLRPDATRGDIARLCEEAVRYGFAAVCVLPFRLPEAARRLAGSRVRAATVIGFPHGASTSPVKAFEAAEAIRAGAEELDMVMCVGAMKDGDHRYVLEDIRSVVKAAEGRSVKVILETHFLSEEEKRIACRLAVEAGARFVKTATGLTGGGATVADIRLMRSVVGPDFGVKASGGIRTLAAALELVSAGATRLGTSAGVAIVSSGVSSSGNGRAA